MTKDFWKNGMPAFDTKGTADLNAASFGVAGNHDAIGSRFNPNNVAYPIDRLGEFYNEWYGVQSFNIAYGEARYMGVNNGYFTYAFPADQSNRALDFLEEKGNGKIQVVFAHVNDEGEVRDFYRTLSDVGAQPDLFLGGHAHNEYKNNPNTIDGNPVHFMAPGMVDNDAAPFNLFKVDDDAGTITPVGNNQAWHMGTNAGFNWGNVKLKIDYALANEGSEWSNEATITNNLSFSIENARIRFVMQKGSYYAIDNGTITQSFEGTSVHVVDVAVDVPAGGQVTVAVSETGEAPDLSSAEESSSAEVSTEKYIDDCDAVEGWAASTGNIITVSNEFIEGTGSVQMVGAGTDDFVKVFEPAYVSGLDEFEAVLGFWYYVSDVSLLGDNNQVELGSGGANDVDEYNWDIGQLDNGWNYIDLTVRDANVIGAPDLNNINWFRVYHSKTGVVTARIDGIMIKDSNDYFEVPVPEESSPEELSSAEIDPEESSLEQSATTQFSSELEVIGSSEESYVSVEEGRSSTDDIFNAVSSSESDIVSSMHVADIFIDGYSIGINRIMVVTSAELQNIEGMKLNTHYELFSISGERLYKLPAVPNSVYVVRFR